MTIERACVGFRWIEDDVLGPHAGILVPVSLPGGEQWFQLDTGLDVSVVYGPEVAARLGAPGESEDRVSLHGRLGARMLLREARIAEPDEDPWAGSIGLDALVGAIVVLDFRRARLCLVDAPPDARPYDTTHARPLELRNGKAFLELEIDGRPSRDYFYDSGASAMGIVTDAEPWAELTGVRECGTACQRRGVKSFAQTLATVTAPARQEIAIGGRRHPGLPVTTVEDAPALFSSWSFPAKGLVGSLPFLDACLVLDLRQGQERYAVIEGEGACVP